MSSSNLENCSNGCSKQHFHLWGGGEGGGGLERMVKKRGRFKENLEYIQTTLPTATAKQLTRTGQVRRRVRICRDKTDVKE